MKATRNQRGEKESKKEMKSGGEGGQAEADQCCPLLEQTSTKSTQELLFPKND